MQFFYIDYLNGDKKERNIGFLKADQDGISVGLHGVPVQCGSACKVYAINDKGTRCPLGQVAVKNGNGMEKFRWAPEVGFRDCVAVEIPLYGTRIGKCVLRERSARQQESRKSNERRNAGQQALHLETKESGKQNNTRQQLVDTRYQDLQRETREFEDSRNTKHQDRQGETRKSNERRNAEQQGFYTRQTGETSNENKTTDNQLQREAYIVQKEEKHEETIGNIVADKWTQLMETYPRVHIFPEAQSVLIKPKDLIVLTEKYHEMATNSFVLHAYYNYRQLLLFCYPNGANSGQRADADNSEKVQAAQDSRANVHVADNSYGTTRYATKGHSKTEYYLGVPGIYYERECRIAEMFGFEGFENGEARMHEEIDRVAHTGCFGYYMKRVEI